MNKCSVTFLPDEITINVDSGVTLAEAAKKAGIALKMTCGGEGTCGKCTVLIKKDGILTNADVGRHQLERALACKTIVTDDIRVEIPLSARLSDHQILMSSEDKNASASFPLQPLCARVAVKLSPPSIQENASDWSRLSCELSKTLGGFEVVANLAILKKLAHLLRASDWEVTATLVAKNGYYELVDLEAGKNATEVYGLAVDVGTTTVVAYLVDLSNGKVLSKAGTYNKQAAYGDDIISRIIHCQSSGGLEQLQQAAIKNLNELLDQLITDFPGLESQIKAMTVAGNTTMIHLLLGLDPKYIRLEPYIPTAAHLPLVKGKDLGLDKVPEVNIYCLPSVGSYVGGDIVSGVLYIGFSNFEGINLFIDIGTNGEIVLGNKEWLISCACSAGPAFEGSGITCGMRAMQGAIERIEIDPESFEVVYQTIDKTKPVGICGSGLIDCIAKLHSTGLIDRAGRFIEHDITIERLRNGDEGKEFVLAWDWETATDKDIIITEGDIQNLIRAKGAIFAGIQCLLKSMQIEFSCLEKIYIGGGFGNYLNIYDAIEIGLLPDLPHDMFEFVGNTSVKGAYCSLVSQSAFAQATDIGKKMTYLELSAGNSFMEEFISSLFLPHTDLELFPTVKSTAKLRGGISD